MFSLIPLIILFPLLGVIINGFWGYRLGRRWVGIIGPGVVGLAFLISIGVVLALNGLPEEERMVTVTLFDWIRAGDFHIPMALMVDPLSGLMLLIVTGIGFLIHLYSVGYMADDAGYARFFTYLNLFIVSMLVLVLGANFLLLFAGWELVGLCSFLLISFWYTNSEYASAGRKAFVVNRIGDFGFALGIMLIFVAFGTLDYLAVFDKAKTLPAGGILVTTITLLLFVGAVGKSAQIPLFVWLPDAMAGPTPVSALIHAATMVTAGVYMIARTHTLYDLAPTSQLVVAIVGAATALFAALIAITQTDIKKVLAYSTVSQLGYMVLGVGAGAYVAGVFHLYTHAFFKALLFLGAGSVMHALGGEQDMRRMGGLLKYIRTTGITFIMGAVALAGIFPFAGFWSKDEVLAATFNHGGIYQILWGVGILTAFITAFYTLRQVGLVFFGEERWRTAQAAGHGTLTPQPPLPHGERGSQSLTPPSAHPHEERGGQSLMARPAVSEEEHGGAGSGTLAPGEKPKRPRPGQMAAASPAPEPTPAPEPPAAETSGEKPKRPRPGQMAAASPTPETTPAPEPPAAETPAEKPKRPRPGQTVAASAPLSPSVSESVTPLAVETPAEKPRRPRPGQATEPSAGHAPTDTGVSHTPPVTPHPSSSASHQSPVTAHQSSGHGGHGLSGEPHESPPSMTIPLIILMFGAVAAGWFGIPGLSAIEHWLEPVFGRHEMKVLASPLVLAGISLAAALAGALLAMSMYNVPLFGLRLPRVAEPARVAASLGALYRLSYDKFRIDELYDALFVQPFKNLATWFWRAVDQNVIDGLVNGVGRLFRSLSGSFRRLQTGYVRNYALWMLVGVVVMIIWFFYQ